MSDQVQQYKHPSVCRFNIDDDYYKDGMVLYSDGLLEINVGGKVYGASLGGWYKAMEQWKIENARIKELEEENKIQRENIRAVLSPDHTACNLETDHLREENQKLRAELDEAVGLIKTTVQCVNDGIDLVDGHHEICIPHYHDLESFLSRHAQQGGVK